MNEQKKLPAGFVVPVLNSLNRPSTFLWAPFEYTAANLVLGVVVGLNLKGYLIFAVNIIIQLIGWRLTKKDPFFMKILMRSISIKGYYDV